MSTTLAPCAVIACVTLAACGPSDVVPAEGTVVRDSAGVLVVTNYSPPSPGSWQVDASPFLEVGSVTEGELELLSFVRQATLLPDGSLAIIDRMGRDIRLFDPSGRAVRRIGKAGDGPGEFGADPFIAIRSPDTVVAWDQRHFRLSEFNLEGALLSEQTLRDVVMAARVPIVAEGATWSLRNDGTLLSNAARAADYSPGAVYATTLRMPTLVNEGQAIRLPALAGSTEYRLQREDGMRLTFGYRLGGHSSWALGPEPYTVTAYSPDRPQSLHYYDREGNLAQVVTLNVPQIPVTRTVVARELEHVRERAVPMRVSADRVIAVFQQVPLPDSIPPFGDHWRLPDGHEVIAHRAPSTSEYVSFEVIDPSGVWAASIRLSHPLGRILEFGLNHVIVSANGPYDVPYVRVHRVSR